MFGKIIARIALIAFAIWGCGIICLARDLSMPPASIKGAKVETENAAKRLAFDNYIKRMKGRISATEYVSHISNDTDLRARGQKEPFPRSFRECLAVRSARGTPWNCNKNMEQWKKPPTVSSIKVLLRFRLQFKSVPFGTWSDYEGVCFEKYSRVTDVGPLTCEWINNQSGQSSGCEATATHETISAPRGFLWAANRRILRCVP